MLSLAGKEFHSLWRAQKGGHMDILRKWEIGLLLVLRMSSEF
jgi:hypothetical protein